MEKYIEEKSALKSNLCRLKPIIYFSKIYYNTLHVFIVSNNNKNNVYKLNLLDSD